MNVTYFYVKLGMWILDELYKLHSHCNRLIFIKKNRGKLSFGLNLMTWYW